VLIQNEVKIAFEKGYYTDAKLIDIQGKVLLKKSILSGETEITFDVKSLNAGNYLIQLDGKKPITQKLIKQ
jgi:hypothetical protein